MQHSKSRHNILSKQNHDKIQENPSSIIGSVALIKRDPKSVDIAAGPGAKHLTNEVRKRTATEKLKKKLDERKQKNAMQENHSIDETLSVAASIASATNFIEEAEDASNVNDKTKEMLDRFNVPDVFSSEIAGKEKDSNDADDFEDYGILSRGSRLLQSMLNLAKSTEITEEDGRMKQPDPTLVASKSYMVVSSPGIAITASNNAATMTPKKLKRPDSFIQKVEVAVARTVLPIEKAVVPEVPVTWRTVKAEDLFADHLITMKKSTTEEGDEGEANAASARRHVQGSKAAATIPDADQAPVLSVDEYKAKMQHKLEQDVNFVSLDALKGTSPDQFYKQQQQQQNRLGGLGDASWIQQRERDLRDSGVKLPPKRPPPLDMAAINGGAGGVGSGGKPAAGPSTVPQPVAHLSTLSRISSYMIPSTPIFKRPQSAAGTGAQNASVAGAGGVAAAAADTAAAVVPKADWKTPSLSRAASFFSLRASTPSAVGGGVGAGAGAAGGGLGEAGLPSFQGGSGTPGAASPGSGGGGQLQLLRPKSSLFNISALLRTSTPAPSQVAEARAEGAKRPLTIATSGGGGGGGSGLLESSFGAADRPYSEADHSVATPSAPQRGLRRLATAEAFDAFDDDDDDEIQNRNMLASKNGNGNGNGNAAGTQRHEEDIHDADNGNGSGNARADTRAGVPRGGSAVSVLSSFSRENLRGRVDGVAGSAGEGGGYTGLDGSEKVLPVADLKKDLRNTIKKSMYGVLQAEKRSTGGGSVSGDVGSDAGSVAGGDEGPTRAVLGLGLKHKSFGHNSSSNSLLKRRLHAAGAGGAGAGGAGGALGHSSSVGSLRGRRGFGGDLQGGSGVDSASSSSLSLSLSAYELRLGGAGGGGGGGGGVGISGMGGGDDGFDDLGFAVDSADQDGDAEYGGRTGGHGYGSGLNSHALARPPSARYLQMLRESETGHAPPVIYAAPATPATARSAYSAASAISNLSHLTSALELGGRPVHYSPTSGYARGGKSSGKPKKFNFDGFGEGDAEGGCLSSSQLQTPLGRVTSARSVLSQSAGGSRLGSGLGPGLGPGLGLYGAQRLTDDSYGHSDSKALLKERLKVELGLDGNDGVDGTPSEYGGGGGGGAHTPLVGSAEGRQSRSLLSMSGSAYTLGHGLGPGHGHGGDWQSEVGSEMETQSLREMTSELNMLMKKESKHSLKAREKDARTLLREKLHSRYRGNKEDEYQMQLKIKEYEKQSEREETRIINDFTAAMGDWA